MLLGDRRSGAAMAAKYLEESGNLRISVTIPAQLFFSFIVRQQSTFEFPGKLSSNETSLSQFNKDRRRRIFARKHLILPVFLYKTSSNAQKFRLRRPVSIFSLSCQDFEKISLGCQTLRTPPPHPTSLRLVSGFSGNLNPMTQGASGNDF